MVSTLAQARPPTAAPLYAWSATAVAVAYRSAPETRTTLTPVKASAAVATAAETEASPPTISICLQPFAVIAADVAAVKVFGSVKRIGILLPAASGPAARPSA